MRALIRLFSFLLLLSLCLVLVAAWFALSDTPSIAPRDALSDQDVTRAKAVLQRNDPRAAALGADRAIEMPAQDLDLVVNYLLQRLARGHARTVLTPGQLDWQLSVPVPHLPRRNHLNIAGTLRAVSGQVNISSLRIGSLSLRGAIADWIARRLLAAAYASAGLEPIADPVRDLQILSDRVRFTYQWNPTLIERAGAGFLTGSDHAALRLYHDRLVDLQANGVGHGGRLVELLKHLFQVALERSTENDPIAENTALLTVLGTWAGRQDLARLVPDSPRRPGAFRLKIQGRRDFAQHFLVSAALAARGDSMLSAAVGLLKEIRDTEQGSGFSFTDIAADQAGARFGEFATRSPEDARRVQQRLAAGVADDDLMPAAKDLPEHLRGEAFEQRFQHVGSPAYQELMTEIERRIDACGLYRE